MTDKTDEEKLAEHKEELLKKDNVNIVKTQDEAVADTSEEFTPPTLGDKKAPAGTVIIVPDTTSTWSKDDDEKAVVASPENKAVQVEENKSIDTGTDQTEEDK